MGDGRVDWEGDRRDLGRRPKPQVDALNITFRSAPLQQFDQATADPDSRFPRVVAFAARQPFRIEQQEQVDVGRIIELAASELAHGDDGESVRLCAGNSLLNGCSNGSPDRLVSEIGQQTSRLLKRKLTRQVAKGNCESELGASAAERVFDIVRLNRQRAFRRRDRAFVEEALDDLGMRSASFAQEGRKSLCPIDGVVPGAQRNDPTHYGAGIR